jgi:hypothetical protein
VSSTATVDPLTIQIGTFSHVSSTCTPTTSPSAPAPTWGTNKNFCGAARQSATCAGQQVCVARPMPAQPLCVRVPSAGAGCPAGYPSAQGTWFGGFTPATCSCGACTRTANGICPTNSNSYIFTHSQACGGGNVTGLLIASGTSRCAVKPTTCPLLCEGWGTIASGYLGRIDLSSNGTCTRPTNTDTAAAPSGPSTICCQ